MLHAMKYHLCVGIPIILAFNINTLTDQHLTSSLLPQTHKQPKLSCILGYLFQKCLIALISSINSSNYLYHYLINQSYVSFLMGRSQIT